MSLRFCREQLAYWVPIEEAVLLVGFPRTPTPIANLVVLTRTLNPVPTWLRQVAVWDAA